ncbi:hypothetical protein PTKIN_Ptkin01aG0278200 [Pterospermum kingtungense]
MEKHLGSYVCFRKQHKYFIFSKSSSFTYCMQAYFSTLLINCSSSFNFVGSFPPLFPNLFDSKIASYFIPDRKKENENI